MSGIYLDWYEAPTGAVICPGDRIDDRGDTRVVSHIYKDADGYAEVHFEDMLTPLDASKIVRDQITLESEA